MKHITLLLSFLLLTTCADAQGWGKAWGSLLEKYGKSTTEKTVKELWQKSGVTTVSPARMKYTTQAMDLYNKKEGKALRNWVESSIHEGTAPLSVYPGIKEELLEENVRRAMQKKLQGAENLKYYLDHASEWAPQLHKTITKEAVDYSKIIAPWADIIYLGEMHDQTPLMFQQVDAVIRHLQKTRPSQQIIYLTEFVMDIKTADGQMVLIQTKENLSERLWAYGEHINRIIDQDIPVVGLDNHFAKEFLKDPAQMQQVNQYLEKLHQERKNNKNLREPTTRAESIVYLDATKWSRNFDKHFPFPASLVGINKRNEHWAAIISKVRATHPDAVLVVHAGAGHLNYNLSSNVPRKVKNSKPFVINMSGFNQLGDYIYDKSLRKGTTEIIQVKNRRAAITLGSDAEIYF